ncbi:hypothetical protein CRUP_035104 [Coryphaenoides rupestris]|nr:hypothetical protein CRUP_035104 [Coryphaenoides rupestris]
MGAGTPVTRVTATDADDPVYGNSAKLVYSILEGQPYFSIDPNSATVKIALHGMDREMREEYLVVIQAKDMGGHMGGLSGTTTVTVTLTDVNDNPPKFSKSLYEFVIPEDLAIGKAGGKVKANDRDIGENGKSTYNIIEGDERGIVRLDARFPPPPRPPPRTFTHNLAVARAAESIKDGETTATASESVCLAKAPSNGLWR